MTINISPLVSTENICFNNALGRQVLHSICVTLRLLGRILNTTVVKYLRIRHIWQDCNIDISGLQCKPLLLQYSDECFGLAVAWVDVWTSLVLNGLH